MITGRSSNFRRAIAPQLETIDAVLAQSGLPIVHRPLRAASLFTEHALISVDGDDNKDDYFTKPWFAAIYAEVHKWYQRKYGALLKADPDTLKGLIVHNGIYHVLEVPKTIVEHQEGGLIRLTFPSRVYESEDPIRWVHPKIPKRLVSAGGTKLLRRVSSTCTALRTISLNTAGAGGERTGVPLMARSIIEHLGKAATTANSLSSTSLAIWDLHQACEKAIKSLLIQRGHQPPRTHNLAKLTSLLSQPSVEAAAARIIRRLPDEKLVISHRYQEEPAIQPNDFCVLYALALRLCAIYTSELRGVRFKDASLILQDPPWFSQLKLTAHRDST